MCGIIKRSLWFGIDFDPFHGCNGAKTDLKKYSCAVNQTSFVIFTDPLIKSTFAVVNGAASLQFRRSEQKVFFDYLSPEGKIQIQTARPSHPPSPAAQMTLTVKRCQSPSNLHENGL